MRREGGGAGLPVLRRADADRRAPAGPDLAPLSRTQARRLVTTVPEPLSSRTDRDAGDGSPRHVCPGAVENRQRSATETIRRPVLGGSRRPPTPWRGVRRTPILPAATVLGVSRRAQFP